MSAADPEIEAATRAWHGHPRTEPAPMHARDFPLPNLGPRLAAIRDEWLHGRGFSLVKGLPVRRWGLRDSAIALMGLGAQWACRARRTRRGTCSATCAT